MIGILSFCALVIPILTAPRWFAAAAIAAAVATAVLHRYVWRPRPAPWGLVAVATAAIAGGLLAQHLGGGGSSRSSQTIAASTGTVHPSLLRPGWGPPRPGYRCDRHGYCQGADHVSLDTTVNLSGYGDLRLFLSGKVEGRVGPMEDPLDVEPGDVIVVRMPIVNDGDPYRPHARSLVARGLTGRLELPAEAAKLLQMVGWFSADNAYPRQVYDSLTLRSRAPVRVRFFPGSGLLVNKAHPDGLRLPDSLAGEGATLGYRRLDGNLDTCLCHLGNVFARVFVLGA